MWAVILKRSALLLLTCGALVAAGCGDDDDDKNSSDAPAVTATTPAETPAETTPEEPTTTAGDTGGANTDNPQVQAAVEACQSSIDNNAQLSEGAKKELANVCKDAASGDEKAVKEATKKVCLKVLEETGVTGPAADQAKQACEAAAK
ncbi:MAG TPA: hypothetical protein VFZ89_14160 [Solirubrobacteraceae bacterium]